MPRGTVDFCTSRRIEDVECEYWIAKDEKNPTLNEYDLDEFPDGTFYANEVNVQMDEYQVVANDFMFESSNVTLKTNDDIRDITENSVVRYDGKLWRVKNVQKEKVKKHSFMSNESTYRYYLTLRG